jgi:GNAT superfamily N-acetyltransferase
MRETRDAYELKPIPANELTKKDVAACVALIKKGEAVDWQSALRELPVATAVVIVRRGSQLVGVGAIKRERRKYAAKIAKDSGFDFPPEMLDLGYVAVDPEHQGHGLSHRITDVLLAGHSGTLFATTYNERMKSTLETAGFAVNGHEWKGRRFMLSLWLKE